MEALVSISIDTNFKLTNISFFNEGLTFGFNWNI